MQDPIVKAYRDKQMYDLFNKGGIITSSIHRDAEELSIRYKRAFTNKKGVKTINKYKYIAFLFTTWGKQNERAKRYR